MLLLLKDDTGFVAPMRSGHVLLALGRRGRTGASRSFPGLAPAENLELPFVIELSGFIHFRQTPTFEGRGQVEGRGQLVLSRPLS